MTEQLPLLQLHHITKKFGNKLALDDISLKLPKGKIIGLLGPNGSGKTTLIKLANGLLQPTAGEIVINGLRPCPETKSLISYLPDTSYLSDKMKVHDILKLFEDFYVDFDRQKAEQLLEDLAIAQSEKLKNLSKGNKEKVQLILVMSRDADLYLLDEPIAGVDPVAREYILDTIIKNYNRRGTIIISTHLIADVERVLDEVIFINKGDILLHESAEHIKSAHNKSIDEYFREVFK